MDSAMGIVGGGPCQRRLAELPLISLCWGAYGEGSTGVQTLVTLLATCRVRTLALHGETPSPQQMGLEVKAIRHRLEYCNCEGGQYGAAGQNEPGGGGQWPGQQEEAVAEEGGDCDGARQRGRLVGALQWPANCQEG